jgi:hypothetical protein
VGAAAQPNDVRVPRAPWFPVSEQGSTVVGPGHLPHAGSALNRLDPKAFAELPNPEIVDELADGFPKRDTLSTR